MRAGRDPTERELVRTRAKIGELMMKLAGDGPARKEGVPTGNSPDCNEVCDPDI